MKKNINQKVGADEVAVNHNQNGDCNNRNSNDGKTPAADVMVFENPEFGKIRTMTDEKGEPLFCGKDVCKILGYSRAADAVNRHVEKVDSAKRRIYLQRTLSDGSLGKARIYQTLFVTESGFYSLVFGSKLPIAQRFKHWVTSVVLPSIRKRGGYILAHETDSDEDIRKRAEDILQAAIRERDARIALQKTMLDEQSKRLIEKDNLLDEQGKQIHEQGKLLEGKCKLIAEQEVEIDRLLPKALYADNVLDSISCYTTTQIAKELGMTAQELNRLLCAERVQYYQSGQYMLYAEYAHRGLAKSRTHFDLFVGCDTIHTRTYLVWTERGRKFIHQLVKA